MSKCTAVDCKRGEPLGAWARCNGLETRHDETDNEHAARCLAYMASSVGRRMDTKGWCKRMAQTVGIDEITMQAAIDERLAWNEENRSKTTKEAT